jgi:adenosylhomocysteine nucleosidase
LLVFVAAESREFEGLLAHVSRITKPGWPLDFARQGRLNGVQVAMVANGPGPKLAGDAIDTVARNAVGQNEHMDALVSIGFCGGLQPALGACDIFVATEVAGVATALQPASPRPFQTGKLLSIDRVVSTAGEKAELGKTGVDAVEMEAAAVAVLAKRYNVPFYAVRVVTDTCGENFPLDFNAMRSGDGRFSRAKIIAAALRRPAAVFPELIKLNKRTKRAAQALGDFLADARF